MLSTRDLAAIRLIVREELRDALGAQGNGVDRSPIVQEVSGDAQDEAIRASAAAFYRACVACHNDQIAQGRQWPSREAVANRVSIEISRGAQVSPPEVQPLVDYIFTNFGVKGGRGPARGAK